MLIVAEMVNKVGNYIKLNFMTQKYFNEQFKEAYPNYTTMTLTDRRLTYNDFMEMYCRSGLITERQRQNWGHPNFLTTNKNKIDCSAY